ncbi:SDR family oxidoreductase [Micromonospora sp. NPDC047134]|uniref:SDR family NAD(P)-dependent oxidoreductase n=1 Tax=Micromonospora sp. NPDC047134 TaxID=3154340 RepID=UPI0033E5936A
MTELDGRTALVTGASGHLGGAVCRALAAQGARVVGTYRGGAERIQALADEYGVIPHQVDLSDGTAVAGLLPAMTEVAGALDILVCAHGVTERRPVVTARPGSDAGDLWRLNVSASVALAGAAGRQMLRRRHGRIVLLGSRAGTHGMPGQADYAASKAALSAWATSAAWELGPFGVTVNVVAPGAVEPDPQAPAVYSDRENQEVVGRIALRRLGAPAEVAAVVAFLAGPGAGYLTGQTLLVDGGARW